MSSAAVGIASVSDPAVGILVRECSRPRVQRARACGLSRGVTSGATLGWLALPRFNMCASGEGFVFGGPTAGKDEDAPPLRRSWLLTFLDRSALTILRRSRSQAVR